MEIQNYMVRLSMKTFLIMYLTAGLGKAALSDEPWCWETFNASHVLITCETTYRTSECLWMSNGISLEGDPPVTGYYSSSCKLSLAINRKGSYTVSIRIVRDFIHNKGNQSGTDGPVKEIKIEIVPPRLSMYNAATGVQITSEIIVKEKQTITLECNSTGGRPSTSEMILSCPRDRKTSNYIEQDDTDIIRLSVGFNSDMNGKQCSCSVQHPSGPSSINLMILIVVPPRLSMYNAKTGVQITSEIIVKEKQTITLECKSNGGRPAKSKMILSCPRDGTTRNQIESDDTDIIQLSVRFNNDMNGRKCSCSVQHPSGHSSIDLMILIVETPDQPTLSASNGSITNSVLTVTEEDYVILTCSSNGGKPKNTYMNLECKTYPPYTRKVYNMDTVSRYFTIKEDMNGKKCICSAKHITTQIVTTELTIYVLVPPRLSMYNAGTGVQITSEIIVKEKQTITLECKSNGGRPAKSKMILSCPSDGTNGNQIEYDDTDIIHLSVGFNNEMDGRKCSCSVQHPAGHSRIDLMILIVVTPSNPVFYADKGLVIDSKLIVKENERVNLRCKSLGGKPKQSDMTISCHYQILPQYTDTIGTIISFTRYMNGQQCICSAKHISSNESLITLLTITVVVVPQNTLCHTDFDKNSAIITCTTSKVFPGANCQFKSFDGFEILMLPMAEASRKSTFYYPRHGTVGYYNTTCRTSLAIKRPSKFTITISMFPELQLRNELEKYYNFVQVNKNLNFEVDSAKIQTFTINKRNPNDVKHVNAKSETTLTCTAFGNPLPTIVISYIDSTRESTTISRGNAYELSHKFNPTCSDTGLYRCNVSNMLNAQEETYASNLKVACPAEYYQTTYNLPRFGVPVNEDFNITLPVRVYPEPKNFSLFHGSSPIRSPKKILFTYTNENFSLGEISIAMYLQNETGLGVYSLRVRNSRESTLNFNLTAEGPPLCPTEFIIQNVSANAMTISWRPGFDGGLRQTFSVFSHDPANNITDSSQVEHTSNDVMVYNVTDLSEGTLYILSVVTENSKGKTKCPHLNINGTTLEGLAPTSVTSAFITTITSSVAGILIVLTLGIISVILMRTRRCHQPVSLDFYQAFSSRITFKHQREHTVQNQLYNGVSGSIAEEDSTLNLGGVSTFKSLSTNAPGNPHFKIESAAIGEIYANVVKFESDAAQNVNNSAGVYNNTKSLKASGNGVKKSNILAAMKHSKPRGQEGIDESGRTVNADGLTYVSVVVKPKDIKMKFGEGEEDTVRGPIDYVAIDLAATSEANREKMAKK